MLRLVSFRNTYQNPLGQPSGTFVCDDSEWEQLLALVEDQVLIDFGQPPGSTRHMTGYVHPSEISILSEDQDTCQNYENTGFNPLLHVI